MTLADDISGDRVNLACKYDPNRLCTRIQQPPTTVHTPAHSVPTAAGDVHPWFVTTNQFGGGKKARPSMGTAGPWTAQVTGEPACKSGGILGSGENLLSLSMACQDEKHSDHDQVCEACPSERTHYTPNWSALPQGGGISRAHTWLLRSHLSL